LFHGTFLLNLDIALVEKALPMPSRQPDYRLNRPHFQFLRNLNLPAPQLKSQLAAAWRTKEPLTILPIDEISRLVAVKYGQADWNFKF
jgi:lipoate-protein ligase A